MKKAKKVNPRHVGSADLMIGNRIRALRMDRNLSQQDVADHLGVSFQQIQKYERGVNRLAMARANQLAALFETPIQEMIGAADNVDLESPFDTESYKLAREFRLLPDPLKVRIRQLIKTFIEIRE